MYPNVMFPHPTPPSNEKASNLYLEINASLAVEQCLLDVQSFVRIIVAPCGAIWALLRGVRVGCVLPFLFICSSCILQI